MILFRILDKTDVLEDSDHERWIVVVIAGNDVPQVFGPEDAILLRGFDNAIKQSQEQNCWSASGPILNGITLSIGGIGDFQVEAIFIP